MGSKVSLRKLNFFSIFVSMFIFSCGVLANECTDLARKNSAAKAGDKLENFQWSQFKSKDVVLIGDEHGFTNPADILQVAQKIKLTYEPKVRSCFFLEFSASLTLAKFKEILNLTTGDREQMNLIRYFKSIFEGAEQLGFDIHLVDHEEYFERDLTLNERDEGIAQNISALFKREACEKGIMVVGKAHIAPDEPNRKLVRDNLSEMSVTSSTINIQYANERMPHPALASWNRLCPVNVETIPHASIFRNDLISDLALYPRYSQLTLFGFFDFTILFP